MNPLLIRTDITQKTGAGHFMRCLALAQAWRDIGGTVTLLMTPCGPSSEQRILTEDMNVLTTLEQPGSNDDAAITAKLAKKIQSSWVVIDGYHFGAEYQKTIKDSGLSLLCIDDYGHADHYCADIVLNQNIYADMSFYPKHEQYTQFLLGTKYTLIRKEFLQWSNWHREIPEDARKILVTLGGSDPDNITLKVIEAMKTVDVRGLEVIVVVGGINPNFALIREAVKDLSNFVLIKNAENMPELMAWADVAISAGGSTCWELAFMGVPGIIITLADNQQLISQYLDQKISYISLGWYRDMSDQKLNEAIHLLISDHDKRLEISQKAQKLLDGKGAIRVVQKIINL